MIWRNSAMAVDLGPREPVLCDPFEAEYEGRGGRVVVALLFAALAGLGVIVAAVVLA